MASILAKLLPLADDPFPPTHKAESEFEGFFLRLQSHSGRSHSKTNGSTAHAQPSKPNRATKEARNSPSRIPRLSQQNKSSYSPSTLRHRRDGSSSSSSDPPSPTPASRRSSRQSLPSNATSSARGEMERMMLTDRDPVFDSPESYLEQASSSSSFQVKGELPTSTPGDLILVVCELQSAPIDQRICIYLRWIVHGEDEEIHDTLYSSFPSQSDGSQGGVNGNGKGKGKARGESFELAHYIPSWQVQLGACARKGSVQPFRIDLPCTGETGLDTLGFFSVSADGNLSVDITLPNSSRSRSTSSSVGTRVRIRSTEHKPWSGSRTTSAGWLPIDSRGPEGLLQHLGALLPLHWYVHSSSAPSMFSLEHLHLDDGETKATAELSDAVAAGRGLLHLEKNWGQAFPSGWMWCHAASPLDGATPIRLSLAGGSILGLTAFLVGVKVGEHDWNFTPPFAVAPKSKQKYLRGPGIKMHRDFQRKTFQLDVWDITRWASIEVKGEESTFATQIPGPCKGGWTPAYCHHSYRYSARIRLYKRISVANPRRALRQVMVGEMWDQFEGVELGDRVALEFGGDFAQ